MQTVNGVCTLVKSHFATLIPTLLFKWLLWLVVGAMTLLFKSAKEIDLLFLLGDACEGLENEIDALGVMHDTLLQFLEITFPFMKLNPVAPKKNIITAITGAIIASQTYYLKQFIEMFLSTVT